MMTILAERPVPSCPEFQSLVRTRAERFSALFGACPDAVVVRREAAGGSSEETFRLHREDKLSSSCVENRSRK